MATKQTPMSDDERTELAAAGFLLKPVKAKKAPKPLKRTPIKRSRKPIAKKSKSARAVAKDDAWKAFSLYIRTRDSLETTRTLDMCLCVTCNRPYPRLGKGCIQAGHFLSGRTGAVLFSEQGVHGQCYGCNVGKGGHYVEYTLYMINRYGRLVVDQMIIDSKKTLKYNEVTYREIEAKYTAKTNELIEGYISSRK